jgi:hypothetical protein
MAYMTDAEAEGLDEFFTKNTIMPVPGKLGGIAKLKQSMRPGEPLFTECIIEKDEDNSDLIFDGSKDVESFELATAVSA